MITSQQIKRLNLKKTTAKLIAASLARAAMAAKMCHNP
jgi:hypothetical protein